MPTGANLPFLTYKDTGIQSVNTTLTPIEDENVVSQFLSQNSRVYLNGSNDVVLQQNVTDIAADHSITNMPNNLTFRIPNDGDAISKVLFSYSVNVESTSTSPSNFLSKAFGLELIKNVEVRVGNQLWQTLTPEDILARMGTEDDYDTKFEIYDSITSVRGPSATPLLMYNINPVHFLTAGKYNISGTIDLKIFSGSGDKLNTYLQVGAPNNDMLVKIYLNSIIAANSFTDISSATNFETSLIVKRHLLTDTEKIYVKDNVINSLIHTSQNVSKVLKWGTLPSDDGTEFNFTIDISDITINTSHLLIGISTSPYGRHGSTVGINPGLGTNYRQVYQPNPIAANSNAGPGIYDCLSHIELFINGSSVTGKLPSSYLLYGAKKMLGLTAGYDLPYYCVPLASTKFGVDSLVMSKLSSKKLVLSTNKTLFGGGAQDDNYKILANITGVGTNVVSYAGGNCSQQIAN